MGLQTVKEEVKWEDLSDEVKALILAGY